MAQSMTIMKEKLSPFHFRGQCPLCDEFTEFRLVDDSTSGKEDLRRLGQLTVLTAKGFASWLRSPVSNSKDILVARATADGFGRTVFCDECRGLVLVCSKCHAAWRHPSDLTANECPNCRAKMFL
jgi:hypothetical protein